MRCDTITESACGRLYIYIYIDMYIETELVTFYDELSSLVRSIPKLNMLVIGGDMNEPNREKRKQQIQPPQHVK